MDKQNKTIVCHDIEGNQKKIDSSKFIFRPSVYGILIENNKILLSKQWDGYDFPGGGIKIHETIEQALKREFIEETGIEVELIKPIACETSFFHPSHSKKHKDKYWNCPLIYFLVKKIGGEISKDNLSKEELNYVDMPEWININKIDNIKFYNSIDCVKIILTATKTLHKTLNL